MGNCGSSNPSDIRQANKAAPFSITIKHFTWNRDSHGLFDYENKNIIKGQIKTNSGQSISKVKVVRMVRQKDAVRVLQTKEELKQCNEQSDITELVKINRQFQKYNVESVTKDSKEDSEGLSDACAWIVVKTVKSQRTFDFGYDLKEGDYIKLGRVRFRIREVKCKGALAASTKLPVQQTPELRKFVSQQQLQTLVINDQKIVTEDDDQKSQGEAPTCRLCYNDDETSDDNPLVDCCKCQGSVKFIHLKCLQQWLAGKLQIKTTKFSVSFQWKTFDCEICKAVYPNIINLGGKIFETVLIPKPEQPYIAIEILSRDRNQSKGTHIISFAQKNHIKLGRGSESDVRITDISVSRCHAVIKFENNGFVLEDQKSKFGTLVLMKDIAALTMEQNNNMALQTGRSVISFHLNKEWNVQSCCMGPAVEEQEDNDVIGNGQGDEDQAQFEQQLQMEGSSP